MRWWKQLPGGAGDCRELHHTEGPSGISMQLPAHRPPEPESQRNVSQPRAEPRRWEEAGLAFRFPGQQEMAPPQTQNGPGPSKDILSAKQTNTWAAAEVGTELWSNV